MGSGMLAAMAVFESGYKDEMDEKEAKELVNQAVMAGIFNDLGSFVFFFFLLVFPARP
jgi:20S proteasome subunit beta 2